jgi:hypothetical protein
MFGVRSDLNDLHQSRLSKDEVIPEVQPNTNSYNHYQLKYALKSVVISASNKLKNDTKIHRIRL